MVLALLLTLEELLPAPGLVQLLALSDVVVEGHRRGRTSGWLSRTASRSCWAWARRATSASRRWRCASKERAWGSPDGAALVCLVEPGAGLPQFPLGFAPAPRPEALALCFLLSSPGTRQQLGRPGGLASGVAGPAPGALGPVTGVLVHSGQVVLSRAQLS